MRRTITKQWLMNQGIEVEALENGEYNIWKTSKKGRIKLKITKSTTKHKYGKNMTYAIVTFYTKDKTYITLGLHTIVYVWFKETVPFGYDVNHINGDPLDNRLENLELLTHQENLQKRFKNGINQWAYIYNRSEEERLAIKEKLLKEKQAREKRKEYKEQYHQLMTWVNKRYTELMLKEELTSEEEAILKQLKQERKLKVREYIKKMEA